MALTGRTLGRRHVVRGLIAATTTALPVLQGLVRLQAQGRRPAPNAGGYGPLVPTADLRDGVTRIALPKVFRTVRSVTPER